MPPEMNRFQAAIISRLKIMARLNIAEKRVPQDGRIKLRVTGREIDIRVSIIPMLHGEGVVMRVLDKESMQFSLRGIGMEGSTYATFKRLIQLPHGIILVTGPTGSGKTTTLYSALSEIKNEETKIITTEDPDRVPARRDQPDPGAPESRADVRRQSAQHPASRSGRGAGRRNPRLGNGRERHPGVADRPPGVQHPAHQRRRECLHAVVRHGRGAVPGEQHRGRRDGPAAGAHAVQRVPRSTPHRRRRTCPTIFRSSECRADGRPNVQGRRLPRCRGTGYRGRLGLFELLRNNDEIRHLASERATSTSIKQAAMKAGMRTLRQDGWDKVLRGLTTVEEVLRVTAAD